MSPPAKLIQDLAFNVGLVAYDYNYSEQVRSQRLAFRKVHMIGRHETHESLRQYRIPNMKPSKAELSLESAPNIGLWVGMRPSTLDDPSLPQSRTGESVDDYSGYPPIPYDANALRVIALIGSQGRYTKYYCLADERNGLCVAYHVHLQEVFFFDEYRDNRLRDKDKRKVMWSRKTRAICEALKVTAIFHLREDESEDDDVRDVQEGYSTTGSRTVAQVDTEEYRELLSFVMSDTYTMLHKLAGAIDVLSDAECEVAIQQFYSFAPNHMNKNFTIGEFRQLSQDLVRTGLFLTTRMLRPMIAAAIEAQRITRPPNDRVGVFELYFYMRHVWGPNVTDQDTYMHSEAKYWKTEINKVQTRVFVAENIIQSARRDGDEGIVEAMLPELAKKKARLRTLEERRDQLLNQTNPSTFRSQAATSNDAERPLKRARSDDD